jgi:predicted O-methyltransferase YrrM
VNLLCASESEANRQVNDQVVAVVLQRLTEVGLLPSGPGFDPAAFHQLREQVSAAFQVERSSITTLTARVLFAIAGRLQPRRVLCIGSYQGNSLVWLAGPIAPRAEVLGLDLCPQAVAVARRNFDRIGMPGVRLECADGHEASNRMAGPPDLVLLDADDPLCGKQLYRSLLERLEPSLAPGTVVLAHDACHAPFQADLAGYFEVVRNPVRFTVSMTLAIDEFGLEVTRK